MPVQYWCFARALALLIACSATAYAEKRVALVIGNADYSALSKLTGPVNDAADVEQALRGLGYEIVPPPPGKRQSVDLTEREMRAQLSALAKAARDAQLALLYYAGHGFEVAGENYLLPIDLADDDDLSIEADGLRLDMVLNTLGASLPERSSAVVVLDACRSTGSSRGDRGMVSIDEKSGFFVAFATEAEKTAKDLGPNRRNSPYTQAFLAELAQSAKLPLSNFFIRVRNRVETLASQTPNSVVGLRDDMIGLAPGAVLPTAPAPLAAVPQVPVTSVPVPTMVDLFGATYTMGSPESETGRDGDEKQVVVTVPPFRMGKYEVSNAEFARFVAATNYKTDAERNVDVPDSAGEWAKGPNPGCHLGEWRAGTYWRETGWKTADINTDPVTCVSWNDAQAYIAWLNDHSERPYRLPSEAEQEYAIRSGMFGLLYPWGTDAEKGCLYANVADKVFKKSQPTWSSPTFACDDGRAIWAALGSRAANSFGLFDMSGNLREWSADCYAADRSATLSGTCTSQVLRGGGWSDSPVFLRSANRAKGPPGYRSSNIGFRLAQDR